MIKVESIAIYADDEELEDLLNELNDEGCKIISVMFIGYNPKTQRIYQVVYERN